MSEKKLGLDQIAALAAEGWVVRESEVAELGKAYIALDAALAAAQEELATLCRTGCYPAPSSESSSSMRPMRGAR